MTTGTATASRTLPRAAQRPPINPFAPALELAALRADPVYWGIGVPRGDGRAVLVLPGLGGGDGYLGTLRRWLSRIGYRPVKSGLERNPGWSAELVEQLGRAVAAEAETSGKPVSIIGHSMGGVIGRSIAKLPGAAVERVITLGSPLGMSTGHLPPSVRLTAIYSRQDPIVRYPAGLARDPGAESIEVRGSHIGLAHNRFVYRELGRLLAARVAAATYL